MMYAFCVVNCHVSSRIEWTSGRQKEAFAATQDTTQAGRRMHVTARWPALVGDPDAHVDHPRATGHIFHPERDGIN
jgi:hypothetical protein